MSAMERDRAVVLGRVVQEGLPLRDADDLKVSESSGNVLQDLGAREAEERLAKAELARVIRR